MPGANSMMHKAREKLFTSEKQGLMKSPWREEIRWDEYVDLISQHPINWEQFLLFKFLAPKDLAND